MPSTAAKIERLPLVSCPVGSGRARVRVICSSMRRSSTWLIVAAQAAASPMPRFPQSSAASGGRPGLASSVPTIAVNTISNTTRGLVSSR